MEEEPLVYSESTVRRGSSRSEIFSTTQFSDEENETLVLPPVSMEPIPRPVDRPAKRKWQQKHTQQDEPRSIKKASSTSSSSSTTLSSSLSESSPISFDSPSEVGIQDRHSSRQRPNEDKSSKKNMRVLFDLDYRTGVDWDWKRNIKSVEEVVEEHGILYGVVRW